MRWDFWANLSITQSKNYASDTNFFRSLLSTAQTSKCLALKTLACFGAGEQASEEIRVRCTIFVYNSQVFRTITLAGFGSWEQYFQCFLQTWHLARHYWNNSASFFSKTGHIFGYICVNIRNSTWMLSLTYSCCISARWWICTNVPVCSNTWKYSSFSSWVFNDYTFIAQQSGDFSIKNSKIHHQCLIKGQIYRKHWNTVKA